MRDPKVGELVRAYDGIVCFEYEIAAINGDLIRLRPDIVQINAKPRWFDRRQCVRLKKKNSPREFWILKEDVQNGDVVTERPDLCDLNLFYHVREVKK